jgi:hypothetical protein
MAQAGGLDAHEQFAVAGWGQLEVADRQWPGLGVRAGETDLFEYGAADPHDYQPAPTGRLLP